MNLNLPIIDQIAHCKNLLIAGMGGEYDVFCALPVYFELKSRGRNVHLANLSFSDLDVCQKGMRLSNTLLGVSADCELMAPLFYFLELYLARWFREKRNESITIWCFERTGTRPLLDNYGILTEHLSIDGILLIDGGVDSLSRGDEAHSGTLIEDATSLYAVNELENIPIRLIGCTAFGAELNVTYAHIFENMADLTKAGGFLGACSLTPQMEVYQAYEDAVLYVHDSPSQTPSVINSSLISSVQGHYGNYHLTERTRGSLLWISPLMSIYWFFNLKTVAEHNLYLSQLNGTITLLDALNVFMESRRSIRQRAETSIPLS